MMKGWPKVYGFYITFFLFTASITFAQQYLPGVGGAGNVGMMPDLQQPDTLIKATWGAPALVGGASNPAATWPNYCAPVSAANIWKFYDNGMGMNLAPWSGDMPEPPDTTLGPPPPGSRLEARPPSRSTKNRPQRPGTFSSSG